MDTTHGTHRHGFVPALGHDALTPLYDTLVSAHAERALRSGSSRAGAGSRPG